MAATKEKRKNNLELRFAGPKPRSRRLINVVRRSRARTRR
jgi:hypothetical protein